MLQNTMVLCMLPIRATLADYTRQYTDNKEVCDTKSVHIFVAV